MNLTQATTECPHCHREFHQIDTSEARALSVVRDALARHIDAEHEGQVA